MLCRPSFLFLPFLNDTVITEFTMSSKDLQKEHFPLIERLHTDVLEEKYGKVHVDVIRHSDDERIVHILDSSNTSRTLAVTFFPVQWDDSFIETINGEIRSGQAIGKTFRKHSYGIRKNVLTVDTVRLPKSLRKSFHSPSRRAKIRLSEFYAKKRSHPPVVYGIVAEIYSPDFRPPKINAFDRSQISALSEYLEEGGISKNEIWSRIGRDNDYHDIYPILRRARRKGQQNCSRPSM